MTTEPVNKTVMEITRDGTITLDQMIMMLSLQYDQKTIQKAVAEFCLQTNDSLTINKGMEYLYMNGCYKELEILVKKVRKTLLNSRTMRAEIYQLMIDRKLNRAKPLEILNHVYSLQTNETEIKCLIEFLKISIHYDTRNFGKLGNFLNLQDRLLAEIKDSYLLSFFNIRLYEILFTYYWVNNELLIARKYAFQVLNLTKNPKTKVSIHINLALTYTFDTFHQGMYHLMEATKISEEHGFHEKINMIKNHNLPFLAARHGKADGISSSDISEQAHLEIARGNLKKAEQLLRTLPINTPFQMYYLGLATSDKKLLHQSYNFFIKKRSDYFFSRLPLLAIQKING
ncbi:AimR family lysis-lysogeny pheromone receptor [Virgibacillus flavescens]|uniref:AimR family lysis-lysogeny pheromone receptor n=1 Tax=Virgibacillus flavescens TaxID=1611422 RepID=UPI003D34C339